MTNTTDKPRSYTSRLKEYLEQNKCPKKYLDLISQFAADEAERKKEENEKTKDIMTWGKYRQKNIREVYKLDPQYIRWCTKNSQYLSEQQKELMNELINSE